MDRFVLRQNRPLFVLALLWTLVLLAVRAEGSVPLPLVDEAPDLSWVRRPFFLSLSAWNLDKLVFDPLLAQTPGASPGDADGNSPGSLYWQASRLATEARAKGDDPGLHETAARIAMRAYAGRRNGDDGFRSLALAARSYFLAGMYAEADGVAGRMIARSGLANASLPYYILKGEALFQKRNYLTARECFRRASAGRWDAVTARRIALRIADASFLLGNLAYAEPAYRKVFREGDAVLRAHPLEAIRFGEALLLAEKFDEAVRIFRTVREGTVPADVRAASYLGEGDAFLAGKRLPLAEHAYRYSEPWGNTPWIKGWIRCRTADLAFAKGNRKEAAALYRELKDEPGAELAREAGYKWILSLHLSGDHEGVVREAETYLSRNDGAPWTAAVRAMGARSGVEIVRAAGLKDPARMWTVYSTLLFSFGKTDEGRGLFRSLGEGWEKGRLWGGASSLYAAGGDAPRGRQMARLGAAESAYYRGDSDNVLLLLGYGDGSREGHAIGHWLAAKTFFRLGRYGEASAALARMEAPGGGGADPGPGKELAIFAAALAGSREGTREALKGVDPKSASPALPYLVEWSAADAGKPPAGRNAVREKAPAGKAGELWTDLAAAQRRYRRLTADEGD